MACRALLEEGKWIEIVWRLLPFFLAGDLLLPFALALLFFVLFVMADKPHFRGSIGTYEGLWQRLALLCMYIPLVALCVSSVRVQ